MVTAGAAALALASLQGPAVAQNTHGAQSAHHVRHTQNTGITVDAADAVSTAALALPANGAGAQQANISRQFTAALQRAQAEARAEAQAQAQHRAEAAAARKAQEERQEVARRAAEQAARQRAAAQQAANPSPTPTPTASSAPAPIAASAPASAPALYADNLDGWIKHALAIMQQNGIPGTYNGIYRNIMRESSGNPNAVNNWDSNAAAGTPSEGLLQVIQPTFDSYHVTGTSWSIIDPVANITAACNYAAHVYGSIDNVYSAY